MPRIDMTDILDDPELLSDFYIVRQPEQVDQHGRRVVTPITIMASGIVQPGSGEILNLLPEGVRVTDTIEIWTTYPLQEETDVSAADIIVYHGVRFLVSHLDDWQPTSDYTHVICTRQRMTGTGRTTA